MKMLSFGGIKDGWRERLAVLKVVCSKWHTSGVETQTLEDELCRYTKAKYCVCVNSGSSANLLALASLNLPKESEVLTSGCGFPATLNPILHLGLKPVLVDYELPSHNINLDEVEEKFKTGSIKAILFAHTMGNPVNMARLTALAIEHNVKIIEDCCEALGSTYDNAHVGTFGHAGTFSFYPSHQINGLGMGGAIITNDEETAIQIRSMRAWGKMTKSTTFDGDHLTNYENKIDDVLYDDQFTYTTCGWNMLMPDAASAYARVQITRLNGFVATRRNNYHTLEQFLKDCPLEAMSVLPTSNPAFFGYILTLKNGERNELSNWLLKRGIKSRPFFAGNITRHKPFRHLFQEFPVADFLMRNSMFIGVWHGLNTKDMQYMGDTIREYFNV